MYSFLISISAIFMLSFLGLFPYFIYIKIRKKPTSKKLGLVGANKKISLVVIFIISLVFAGLAEATPEGQELSRKREAERLAKIEAKNNAKAEADKKAEKEREDEARRKEDQLKAENEKKIKKEARASEEIQKSPLYDVVSVTDGDTITINYQGGHEKVRLVGLDTPETKDPRKPIQCFGREASAKMAELAGGKKVRIEFDSTQGQRDKYGRLLLFVFLEDGRNLAYEMINGGYGNEYTYNSNPYKYQAQFKEAQKSARENKRGLWADDTCAGDSKKPASSEPVVVPVPHSKSAPTPRVSPAQPQPAPQPTGGVFFRNCREVRSAGRAPIYRGQPGYGSHLDRDDDGIACE